MNGRDAGAVGNVLLDVEAEVARRRRRLRSIQHGGAVVRERRVVVAHRRLGVGRGLVASSVVATATARRVVLDAGRDGRELLIAVNCSLLLLLMMMMMMT